MITLPTRQLLHDLAGLTTAANCAISSHRRFGNMEALAIAHSAIGCLADLIGYSRDLQRIANDDMSLCRHEVMWSSVVGEAANAIARAMGCQSPVVTAHPDALIWCDSSLVARAMMAATLALSSQGNTPPSLEIICGVRRGRASVMILLDGPALAPPGIYSATGSEFSMMVMNRHRGRIRIYRTLSRLTLACSLPCEVLCPES